MSALTLIVIRHAEKSKHADLGINVDEFGGADDNSLVVRGWQRAGAWAALFGSGCLGADFPKPDIVYAANPNAPQTPDGGVRARPQETVLPLCRRLSIEPNITYGVGDEEKLLGEIRKLTGVVLICWEHKRIASTILPNLAGDQTLPHLPTDWGSTRFDVALRFDRAQSGAQWSFRQMFPRLLAGDLDVPL
jgi:hypothetical protein